MFKSSSYNKYLSNLALLTKYELGWIVGFLEGDGHIGCRLKKRKDYANGFQLLPEISFTQKEKRAQFIFPFMYKLFKGIGSYRARGDGVWAYEIQDHEQLCAFLVTVMPFLLMKRKQAFYCLRVVVNYQDALKDQKLFLELCRTSDRMSQLNDANTGRKNTYAAVLEHLSKKPIVSRQKNKPAGVRKKY